MAMSEELTIFQGLAGGLSKSSEVKEQQFPQPLQSASLSQANF